jgi:hypothetical protein
MPLYELSHYQLSTINYPLNNHATRVAPKDSAEWMCAVTAVCLVSVGGICVGAPLSWVVGG